MVKPSSSSVPPVSPSGDLDDLLNRRSLLSMTTTAKLNNRGRAQTISLPKAFRFPGKTVQLQRTADGVLISSEKRDLAKLRKQLAALAGSCPDFPLREPVQGKDVPRDLDW